MDPVAAPAVINTSDYISFVLSFPNVPPLSVLTLFILGLMRVVPIAAMAPFFGSKLPSGIKMGLSIMLVVIVLPHLIFAAKPPVLAFDHFFPLYCIKELFIGFLLAFLVTVPFYIVQSCGVLIDFLRGSFALQVTDPIMQTQSSPIGQLYQYVFIIIFYEIGGIFIFFDSLLASYDIIPADGFISATFFRFHQPIWKFLTLLLTKFLSLATQLAAPSIVAALMAELFLGITNRVAPRVQITFLGMALKSLSALALLWLGWYFIIGELSKQALLWLQSLNHLIQSIPMA